MKKLLFLIPMLTCMLASCGNVENQNQENNDNDIVEPTKKIGSVNVVDDAGTKVFADVTTAEVGTLVTLTIEVQNGKVIEKVTVNDVNTTSIGNNKYTFNLVEGTNNVRVYLKDTTPEPPTPTPDPDPESNAYITIKENPNVTIRCDTTSGVAGAEAVLYIQPNEGYKVDLVTVNDVKAIKESDTVYSFILVEGENVVKVSTTTKPTEPEGEPEILPNNQEKLTPPDNLNNPIDVSDKYYNFDCSSSVPENFSYIYLDNKTDGDFFRANGEYYALEFGDIGRGIQTPALVSASKYELRLHVCKLFGGNKYHKDKSKDNFIIYGYDENTKLIYQDSYTPFKNGLDKKNENFDIKFYVQNPDVRYFEVRLNECLYDNSKSQKFVSFGVNELTLRSYNF